MLSKFNSDKFKFWSFISMVLLVFVHGHNLVIRTLEPNTIPNEALTLTSFVEYFFANGILRFRIPMLFAISGYLYALYDQNKSNKERIKKRTRTLLLPYVLWVGIYFIAFYLFEMIPAVRDAIAASHVAWGDPNGKIMVVHDYAWWGFVLRFFFPIPYQFWFIRDLFILNCLYPFIRNMLADPKTVTGFLCFIFLGWFSPVGWIFVGGEAALFFTLGVWLQKSAFDIDRAKAGLNPWFWSVVFLTAAALKTWLAFQGQAYLGNWIGVVLIILHKLVIASGLISTWFGLNSVVKWCMSKQWFVWLSSFSFMIYAVHAPLVAIAIDPVFNLLKHMHGYRMLTFVLLPLAIIAFAIIFGAILRKLALSVYSALTGGRGLM